MIMVTKVELNKEIQSINNKHKKITKQKWSASGIAPAHMIDIYDSEERLIFRALESDEDAWLVFEEDDLPKITLKEMRERIKKNKTGV